jgi:hypothetical protein
LRRLRRGRRCPSTPPRTSPPRVPLTRTRTEQQVEEGLPQVQLVQP